MRPIERFMCENLMAIHRRQRRFLETIPSPRYDFDPTTATLRFPPDAELATQILGLETPDGHWMWAWADEDNRDPATKVAAADVRAYGEEHGLEELTTPKLELGSLLCGGHTLAAIATVAKRVHPYFRCVQRDGVAVYVLVTSVSLPDDAHQLAHDEARRAIRGMFADYAQADDLLTLRCALEAVGCEVERTEDAMIGRRGDDPPMRWELAWFA